MANFLCVVVYSSSVGLLGVEGNYGYYKMVGDWVGNRQCCYSKFSVDMIDFDFLDMADVDLDFDMADVDLHLDIVDTDFRNQNCSSLAVVDEMVWYLIVDTDLVIVSNVDKKR